MELNLFASKLLTADWIWLDFHYLHEVDRGQIDKYIDILQQSLKY